MKLGELREAFRGNGPASLSPSETDERVDESVEAEIAAAYGLSTLEMMASTPWQGIKDALYEKAVTEYGWPRESTMVYRTGRVGVTVGGRDVLLAEDKVYIAAPGDCDHRPSIRVSGFGGHELPRDSIKLAFHIPPFKDVW
jgi:hypothetical protein